MAQQIGKGPEYVTVEIYDQTYHLSGQVAAQGRTVDSLRVAVLAALNLADELSQAGIADPQLGHARAASLRGLLDEVLDEKLKTGS
jgi:cell division protein ZapA